ncbi:MAG TPA: tetratricopeptide repeat protein [bacterium]|nr:tetratricopeptide repeat protein [bacterium]
MHADTDRPALRLLFVSILLTTMVMTGHAQRAETDLNSYYKFPLSVGAAYTSVQALAGLGSGYAIKEFGTELRAPLPFAPTVQPLVRAGTSSWLASGSAGSGQFDHSEWFGALGLGFSTRFTKNFELGFDGAGGVSQSYYANLAPGSTVGSISIIADAGARLGLIPSYNLAVDVRPALRWARSTGPLDEFDGFSFGLGFSVSYRFGEDPDAPTALIRALRLSSGKLPAVFAAMQSYYASNPFATVSLTNDEKSQISDLEIAFFQPGYMDAPTPVASVPVMPAHASIDVALLAAFNQEVFRTEGTTPLAGELSIRYRYRGRPVEQRFPLSYDLMDRTAIVWDDDRKVGAFITPADSALRNYATYVRQSLKSETLQQLNTPLQTAGQIYAALGKLGLLYQADPSTPFIKAQTGAVAVDSVSLGRSTLVRGSGDCDDLTVLFASLLESVGIETGFITVPGHIYPVFNTKVQARGYKDINPDRGMMVVVNDELWVPVEITLVGKQTFLDAWRRGSELWRLYESDAGQRAFYKTSDAQARYKPVALKESDLGLQYGSRDELVAAYRKELAQYSDDALSQLASAASKSGDKKDWNTLGVAYARFGRIKDAEASFQRALRIDPAFTSSQVNLGNLAYIQKDYRKALAAYQNASKALDAQGRGASISAQLLLVNISMAYNALSDFAGAKTAYEKAAAIDAARVRDFAYLASVGAGSAASGGRAGEQTDALSFLGDE